MPTTMWRIAKKEMEQALATHPQFSHRFLAYMLQRNIRIEGDLDNSVRARRFSVEVNI
ncbi:MAG: hypothetical protein ABIQ65_20350 [Thermoanaerobaculia bacterium]